MDIFQYLPLFFLILVRITCFFLAAPIYSYHTIPARHKVAFAALIALLLTVTLEPGTDLAGGSEYVLLVLKEAVIGLIIAFVSAMFIYAVQIAGAFIDIQMGFSMVQLLNPEMGFRTPITGQFFYILFLFFFLAANGHHMLLNGLVYSFQVMPVDQLDINLNAGGLADYITQLFVRMFLIAFQMAVPILGSLFLVDVGLGIVARVVPQINVFVVGLPLKILVGLVLIFFLAPAYVLVFREIFDLTTESLNEIIQLLGGTGG